VFLSGGVEFSTQTYSKGRTLLYCVGYALSTLGQMPLGLFPKRLLVLGGIVGLVEIVVGSLAGAWLYKE